MPATDMERELRPATLDDAALVADLESKRDPQEPRDPVMLRYWWQMGDELERAMRRVRVREESAIAFLGVSHDLWLDGGIVMHPCSEDSDPEKYRKLYETMVESSHDVPQSVPAHDMALDQWRRFWFDNPAIRQDRFWVAREGDDIVGCSVLDCPVVRGGPWTAYTGTRRRGRGRGIARALKYQSMAQAIEVGYSRVRTGNDAENHATLRINAQMGYRPVAPIIELQSSL
jgi:GNAT superfamily N-acetyltransferase